jgi:superfamily II DNA or RNA helicase
LKLRPQQQELKNLVDDIESCQSQVKEIFLAWGVGSGKSLAPVILSDLLTGGRLQVVGVPRNSLKTQGELGYNNDIYPVDKTARIASNVGDPHRGCHSCFVSYQGISANPELWIELFKNKECMLVLDEFHHLSEGGIWVNTIRQMKELSFLTVFLSGTISRGDKTKIPFVPYDKNHNIDFTSTDKRKWIVYTTKQALADKAVLPFEATPVNGAGSYIDLDGITRNFDKFTGNSNQLRCSFKSEYAEHMIDLSINHWVEYKKNNPWSKILIVSPDIKTAKEYTEYIKNKFPYVKSAIATSEDSNECKDNIKRFKQDNGTFKYLDCLVNVGICYEGLDVPPASHILALTLIRSIPWLTQMTGRVTRIYGQKKNGFIFCPADPKMIKALKTIEGGVIHPAIGELSEPSKSNNSESTGPARTIEALSSKAHIDNLFSGFMPKSETIKTESQSEKEHRLRTEINNHINRIFGNESPGNKRVKQRVFWLRIKMLVNNGRDNDGKLQTKHLDEMSCRELEKCVEFANKYK